ncbi:MAG: ROK family protein, partial [Treponema sp.]|nr:ROK family protein [Treponema sp.]
MEQYTIGIDVGGTKAAYGVLDGRKEIVRRLTHPSDPGLPPEAFFDRITAAVKELMAASGIEKENLRGVGIGMPSFVLFEEGR